MINKLNFFFAIKQLLHAQEPMHDDPPKSSNQRYRETRSSTNSDKGVIKSSLNSLINELINNLILLRLKLIKTRVPSLIRIR